MLAGYSRVVRTGYQSASVTNLTMISLQPDSAIELLDTSLSSGSDLIRGNVDDLDCQNILDPKYAQPESVSIDSANCEDTKGHWRFEGERIRLTFNWATREANDNGRLKPLKQWDTTAVLQWTGAALKLVEGKLPEFGI